MPLVRISLALAVPPSIAGPLQTVFIVPWWRL